MKMTSERPRRVTINLNDDEYRELVTAVSVETVERNANVSLSEWIRQAIRERLER